LQQGSGGYRRKRPGLGAAGDPRPPGVEAQRLPGAGGRRLRLLRRLQGASEVRRCRGAADVGLAPEDRRGHRHVHRGLPWPVEAHAPGAADGDQLPGEGRRQSHCGVRDRGPGWRPDARLGLSLAAMPNLDYLIVGVVSALAIALHVGLFLLFRRWMDRDLALSLAGDDPVRRQWMLEQLARARREGVRRRDLQAWLEQVAAQGPEAGAG